MGVDDLLFALVAVFLVFLVSASSSVSAVSDSAVFFARPVFAVPLVFAAAALRFAGAFPAVPAAFPLGSGCVILALVLAFGLSAVSLALALALAEAAALLGGMVSGVSSDTGFLFLMYLICATKEGVSDWGRDNSVGVSTNFWSTLWVEEVEECRVAVGAIPPRACDTQSRA